SHLPKDARETAFTILLGVEHGEVLREGLAQPLLVIVLPTDRLAPPLMRQFVRKEKGREVLEVDRIVAPDDGRTGHQLIQYGEVRRTVPAGPVALRYRQGKTRIWSIAEKRRIKSQDPGGPLARLPYPHRCARRALDVQRHVRRSRRDARVVQAIEAADDHGEIPHRT